MAELGAFSVNTPHSGRHFDSSSQEKAQVELMILTMAQFHYVSRRAIILNQNAQYQEPWLELLLQMECMLLLMLLITSVLFLPGPVRMSAVKKVHTGLITDWGCQYIWRAEVSQLSRQSLVLIFMI